MKRTIAFLLVLAMFFPAVSANELLASDWAKASILDANEKGIIKHLETENFDYTSNVNRISLAVLVSSTLQQLFSAKITPYSPNPFSDTDSAAVLRLFSLNIMKGTSESKFEPYSTVTRQELAVIVYRIHRLLYGELDIDYSGYLFHDDNQIDGWAKTAVKFLIAAGVFQNADYFNPKSLVSHEQLIHILNILFNDYSKNVSLNLNQKKLFLGQSEQTILTVLGTPDRVDYSEYGFSWYIYNKDYKNYAQIGIKNGIVEAIYSNSDNASIPNTSIKVGVESSVVSDINSKLFKNVSSSIVDFKKVSSGTQPRVYLEYGPHMVVVFNDLLDNNKISSLLILHCKYSPVPSINTSLIKDYIKMKQAFEKESLDLINCARVKRGLGALTWNDKLADVANKQSVYMSNKDVMEHVNPDQRATEANVRYSAFGEALARGEFNAITAHESLMNSADHRVLLLHPDFTQLGVGVEFNFTKKLAYFTENFIKPAD